MTGDELRGLLAKLRASEACQRHDLIDPLTLFIATGARMSELLGWYWTDFDDQNGTLAVTGKVVRAAGKGLLRIDDTKTAAGRRVLPLPTFAITVLTARRRIPYLHELLQRGPLEPERAVGIIRQIAAALDAAQIASAAALSDSVIAATIAVVGWSVLC